MTETKAPTFKPVYIDLGDGQPHELRPTLRSTKFLRKLYASLPKNATSEDLEALFEDHMEEIVCSMLVGSDRENVTPSMIGDMPGALVNQLSESLAVALTGMTLEELDKAKQAPASNDN